MFTLFSGSSARSASRRPAAVVGPEAVSSPALLAYSSAGSHSYSHNCHGQSTRRKLFVTAASMLHSQQSRCMVGTRARHEQQIHDSSASTNVRCSHTVLSYGMPSDEWGQWDSWFHAYQVPALACRKVGRTHPAAAAAVWPHPYCRYCAQVYCLCAVPPGPGCSPQDLNARPPRCRCTAATCTAGGGTPSATCDVAMYMREAVRCGK